MSNKICAVLLSFILFFSCNSNHKTEAQDKTSFATEILSEDTQADSYKQEWEALEKQFDSLVQNLQNKILLDTLLESITKQQNIKVLAELTEERDGNVYTYSGEGYKFQLELKPEGNTNIFPEDLSDENTVFFDQKKRIAFNNYSVTCCNDTNYICNDFGFNTFHYFNSPKIIEVCGKQFLYADIGFPCNGLACGQSLTMIYDIKEKTPTFVGNYRIPFDNFLISDFNDDGVPELLIIGKTQDKMINNIGVPEFYMTLFAYTYDKGTFKQNKDVYYKLYGIGNNTHYFYEAFSVIEDKWF